MEANLLAAALYDRDAWTKLREVDSRFDGDSFSEPGKIIFDQITEFYETDPDVGKACKVMITEKLERKYPKHYEMLVEFLNQLKEVSVPNVIEEYRQTRLHATAHELAGCLVNKAGSETVRNLVGEYQRLDSGPLEVESATVHQMDANDLSVVYDPANLVHISPKSIDDAVDGGVLREDHILIYGTPEAGKSLIAINLACAAANRGDKVLYCGNEDPTFKIAMRFLSRFTGLTKREVLADPNKANALARERGYDHLWYQPMTPGTSDQIEGLILKYEPKIVIVDQIRQLSIAGIRANDELGQLTAAAKQMRGLAKRRGVVMVSVTQANADACKNKLVLDMDDVYFSNTTVPGDVDVMLAIGVNQTYDERNMRMVNLPKNKSGGGHIHFPIRVDPTLSKAMSMEQR